MKIKKGKKYLTHVSGLGNPDETLFSETLEIVEINGEECVAKGCGSGHTYRIKKNVLENKIASKEKRGWRISEDEDSFLVGLVLTMGALFMIVFCIMWFYALTK